MDARLARINFDFCKETAVLKKRSEISLIELGGRLHKIFSERLYEPNHEHFKDYLEDIKLSPSTASKLIGIYEKFVIQFKYKPKFLAEVGGWSSISEVVSLVDTKKDADIWLAKVEALNRTDLRKEIKEKKTGVLMAKCPHKHTAKFTVVKCEDCGDTWRNYDEESKK